MNIASMYIYIYGHNRNIYKRIFSCNWIIIYYTKLEIEKNRNIKW